MFVHDHHSIHGIKPVPVINGSSKLAISTIAPKTTAKTFKPMTILSFVEASVYCPLSSSIIA